METTFFGKSFLATLVRLLRAVQVPDCECRAVRRASSLFKPSTRMLEHISIKIFFEAFYALDISPGVAVLFAFFCSWMFRRFLCMSDVSVIFIVMSKKLTVNRHVAGKVGLSNTSEVSNML